MTQYQFLYDQARLDSLSEADIVGDQKIRAGHVDSPNERIELKIFYAYAASKRGLQESPVGIRRRTPTYRIQKSFEGRRVVPAGNDGQACALYDVCAGLQFPDD